MGEKCQGPGWHHPCPCFYPDLQELPAGTTGSPASPDGCNNVRGTSVRGSCGREKLLLLLWTATWISALLKGRVWSHCDPKATESKDFRGSYLFPN